MVEIANSFRKTVYSDKKTISVINVFLVIVVALYPILPSYTLFLGLRLHSFLAFASALLLLILVLHYNYRFKKIVLSLFFLIILSLGITSIVNKDFFSTSFVSLVAQYFFLPSFIFVVFIQKQNKRLYLKISIIIGIVLCVLSITELFGFNIFSLICNQTDILYMMGPETGQRFGIYRIESSFGQAIAFSVYLTYILILVYYYIYKYKNDSGRGYVLFVLLIFFFNLFIVLTLSRFPILVAILVNIVGFFTLNKNNKKIFALFSIVSLAIMLIFLSFSGENIFIKLINNIISTFKGESSEEYNPFSYRLGLFTYIQQVLDNNERWFFGVGMQGNYSFLVPTEYGGYTLKRSIDNGFLSILVSQGIIGLLTWSLYYLFFVVIFFKMAFTKNALFDRKSGLFGLLFVVVALLNMLSVARLDESRAFCVFVPLILSCGLDHDYKERNSSRF